MIVLALCLVDEARCWAAGESVRSVVDENALEGTPAALWDVDGAGDPTIQGFATDISINRGETVRFKVTTDASAFRVEIYRVGYYRGAGARKVADIGEAETFAVRQPECLKQAETGLVDCGNWQVSASWDVPARSRSGVYVARIIRSDTSGASHIMFVVRDDDGGSGILLQTSDTTWQAYNDYGGNSLYEGEPAGRAYKVSYNRPLIVRGSEYRRTSFWANEYPMIRWLEANGYDVSYLSGVDTARRGHLIRRHKLFVSSGHDEYWSGDQRDNVEAARDAGVNLAFFSGNSVFWKTRWEPSIDASGREYRTLVCYKETHAGEKIDPSPLATGTWRDPRFSPPNDSARPENALKGTIYVANCCRFDAVTVSADQAKARFWRNTGLDTLSRSQSVLVGLRTVGFEWDSDLDNGSRPAGLVRLSSTRLDVEAALRDFGSNYGSDTVTHNVTLFRHKSGSLVFAAGTTLWGWALDATHDDPDKQSAPTDLRLQQATVNLLADMSLFPASPNGALVVTQAPPDTVPPVASIRSPRTLEDHMFHLPVSVSGSATDQGGVPAGIEVSVDGGANWHPANGVSDWSYTFTPDRRSFVSILARAVDDSGNLQPVPTSVTIKVSGFARLIYAGLVGLVLGCGALLLAFVARRRRLLAKRRMMGL
ncbi:hypothetical protein OPKNFCMD_6475 [Methylobacterium crusticola]|uniref:N,N-dimethylformamidase beta subunit-like C-terminal domain-containing protein n=1 Tax=Methylobacterium crusticola TaxID=1697972 RepID=A0ABQ4R7M6_9HYPH|nr:N,N-dimethylformamidase beta subunit family domain-containing protein [Methylobacterium crusticola]GJD53698.1 hypothetical protein OPKNFCMD_6475 [Methylobacterium crusticola]